MTILWLLLGLVLSYLLGAFPSAYIITMLFSGKDIRKLGSGNVGATNTLRVLGKLPGIIVLCLDIVKGIIAVTILTSLISLKVTLPLELVKSLLGLFVVLGHVFNVFLKFRGGKGVATSAGVIFAVAPHALSIGAITFIGLVILTKYVSVGSIVSSIIIPFILLFAKVHYSYVVLSAFLCIIIVIKHKANINRLLNGRERKVFEKNENCNNR